MVLMGLVSLCMVLSSPDVYFLSVDTLRADRLGCYGGPESNSPNLDALARDALVFDDFLSEMPLTGPSFSAMMTSRFPRSSGARCNGRAILESIPTLAEQFRDAG